MVKIDFKSEKQQFIYQLIVKNPGISQTQIREVMVKNKMYDDGTKESRHSTRVAISSMLGNLKKEKLIVAKEVPNEDSGSIRANLWYRFDN